MNKTLSWRKVASPPLKDWIFKRKKYFSSSFILINIEHHKLTLDAVSRAPPRPPAPAWASSQDPGRIPAHSQAWATSNTARNSASFPPLQKSPPQPSSSFRGASHSALLKFCSHERILILTSLSPLQGIQLTLEKHGFELQGSFPTQIFFNRL